MAGDQRIALYLFIFISLSSFLYQTIGKDMIWVQIGYRRKIEPISKFAYTCRRLRDPGLEACEDMWLSENSRQLFLACSDSTARKHWMPNVHRLDASRRSQRDKLIAMDIDKPEGNSFAYRTLSLPDYSGVHGDGKLYLVAVTGVDNANSVDLYINNNRPSINPTTGDLLNNEETGANSTIELFRIHNPTTATTASHIKTFSDPQIATPNRIAPVGDGSFFFTNDHGLSKTGFWWHYSPLFKTGTVSFCPAQGACKRVDSGYRFPNGLALGRKNGLLYVPSTMGGDVMVYRPNPDGSAKKIDHIRLRWPLDNISEDQNGDFWVAALPNLTATLGSFEDPHGPSTPPATVFKFSRRTDAKKGYAVTKMLEDRDGEVLPFATTVVHDAKTGRLFISGVVAPFITVCDPR